MVDPVVGGLAGELLQDGREVLGGDAHLAGIEANGVFFAAVLEHQFQKLLEQLFLTRTLMGASSARYSAQLSAALNFV